MSRDDSLLYTGATSTSFGTNHARVTARDKKIEQKAVQQQKLTPAAEVVNDVIKRERDLVTQELASLPLNVNITTENVKELLMAYQRNLKFIDSFQTKINNALRKANK